MTRGTMPAGARIKLVLCKDSSYCRCSCWRGTRYLRVSGKHKVHSSNHRSTHTPSLRAVMSYEQSRNSHVADERSQSESRGAPEPSNKLQPSRTHDVGRRVLLRLPARRTPHSAFKEECKGNALPRAVPAQCGRPLHSQRRGACGCRSCSLQYVLPASARWYGRGCPCRPPPTSRRE